MGTGKSDLSGRRAATAEPTSANRNLTDDEMQAEMDAEFTKINDVIDAFMNQKGRKDRFGNIQYTSLDDMPGAKELGLDVPIEKHTMRDMVKTYIDEFNQNVKDYGDGFEFYDPDEAIAILYKDGRVLSIDPSSYDGSKKIPTKNIDSVIVDSGWGIAIAGKNVQLYNYREAVMYRKDGDPYGYRSVKQRYDDVNSIRADFK